MIKIFAEKPANDAYIRRIMDIETSVYGPSLVGDRVECIARYHKNPTLTSLAFDGEKLIGACCAYPVSERVYRRVFEEGAYVDSDLLAQDVLQLSNTAPNYILILDAIVMPEYQKHGLMHVLLQALKNQLRKKTLEGYEISDIFTFCISDGGRALKESLGFESIREIPEENALLVRKDPQLFITGQSVLPLKIDLSSIQRATDFVDGMLESAKCPTKIIMQTDIAVDEALANIISYSGATRAWISCRAWNGEIELIFRDNGMPYDPLRAPEPDTTLSAEQRGIGGLGIYMIKKSVDSISYSYTDEQNVLKLTKNY